MPKLLFLLPPSFGIRKRMYKDCFVSKMSLLINGNALLRPHKSFVFSTVVVMESFFAAFGKKM
jgi:hypothetical protein